MPPRRVAPSRSPPKAKAVASSKRTRSPLPKPPSLSLPQKSLPSSTKKTSKPRLTLPLPPSRSNSPLPTRRTSEAASRLSLSHRFHLICTLLSYTGVLSGTEVAQLSRVNRLMRDEVHKAVLEVGIMQYTAVRDLPEEDGGREKEPV